MKKVLILLLALCLAVTISACTEGDMQNQPVVEAPVPLETQIPVMPAEVKTPELPFEGKLGVISYTISMYELEYYSAMTVIKKYGEDKIDHRTWPQSATTDIPLYRKIFGRICEDENIRAIIVQGGHPNIDETIKEREEDLKDIFIPYIRVGDYGGEPADIAEQVDLVFRVDELGMGVAMVHQAQKLGAKTFVHYSIPRHMEQPIFSKRHELIKEECTKLGIEFVDAIAPDPQSEVGVAGVQQFILEDVPKMITKYGKDTAFFSTACVMQKPLIKAVIDGGAIYPSPCHPSPYHGLPQALDIEISGDAELVPIEEIVTKTNEVLAEKNMLGRLSTWPVDANMMLTEVSSEYAIKWMNGEVSKEGINLEVLKQMMEDYAGVEVYLTPYTDDETGETYDNYLLVQMDYITF